MSSNGYAVITLDRPEKHNAVSRMMTKEIADALVIALKEPALKCLVITANGKESFCAGGDLNELHSGLIGRDTADLLMEMREVLYTVATFPVPVICLLNGNAYGGGCEIATACDFRISRPGLSFGFIQGKIGIVPGWGGGVLLYKRIVPSLAYQWLVHADIYSGEKLLEWGWIQEMAEWEDEPRMESLLSPYLSKSVAQLRSWKRQYLSYLQVERLREEMEAESNECAAMWGSTEHQQALKTFFNQ